MYTDAFSFMMSRSYTSSAYDAAFATSSFVENLFATAPSLSGLMLCTLCNTTILFSALWFSWPCHYIVRSSLFYVWSGQDFVYD